uniref:G protein-coupled receptor n=1 Tax=Caenorhabditis tropicalis TaxID=1561998 RepID=A0A1I7TXU0_9PELO
MYNNLELPQYLELAGSTLSLFFNMTLLFIIGKFSRPEYGSYRVLMMAMTSLYVIYSSIEILVLPVIFGCMQVVLCVQFIYRFLSIANNNYLRDRYFKGRRHVVWVTATVLFFLNWFTVAWLVFGNQGDHPKELEEAVKERFGRDMNSMAFTLVTYAQKKENGAFKIKFIDITMILYLLFCASIPMTISLVCGAKTWWKIRTTISLVQKSFQLQRQERQLFFALLTQFTIPFLGNTLPMLVLFLCPALHISTEPYTNYICMLIPFYPVFDALATTFIIKDYYRGVLKMFGVYRIAHTTSLASDLRAPPNTLQVGTASTVDFSHVGNYI